MKKIISLILAVFLVCGVLTAVPVNVVYAADHNLIDVNPPYRTDAVGGSAHTYPTTQTASVNMGGTGYKNAIEFRSNSAEVYADISMRFNLNSEYTALSGIIGPTDSGSITNSTVTFWGDGEILREITVIGGALPVSFNVDVKNINQLVIVYSGTNHNRTALANLTAVPVVQQIPYTITTSASPAAGGAAAGGGTYAEGVNVTLSAAPNSGWIFDGWYEGSTRISTNQTFTTTASQDRTLQARFTRQNVTITADSSPADGGTVTGGGTYAAGSNVSLNASANRGWSFDGWYEGSTRLGTNRRLTFTAASDRVIQARFTRQNVTITTSVSPASGGAVTGGGTYAPGANVTLSAAPNSGWSFEGWYENGAKTGANRVFIFTAASDRVLQARFVQQNTPAEIIPPNIESASGWALEQIIRAHNLGLIPQQLQSHYNRPITRSEFASLAVTLYETITGREITGRVSFDDSDDVNVQKAAAIGVMSPQNRERNLFGPYVILSRQDSAGTLVRLANLIGKPLPEGRVNFADNDKIASWALEPVGQAAAARIMSAGSGNKFNPGDALTREECIAAVLRLFNR
ncbi:MAG: InlB B-repeat-containing protein [Oscillospiraceae bacterium]|nr:InlB B-repeat-containing protein [Oscillospiraceae bacterium]